MDENSNAIDDGEMVESSSGKELATNGVGAEGRLNVEPCVVDEINNATDDVGMVESSSRKEFTTNGVEAEGRSNMEPYVGMEFESEEAAKAYYSTYATHIGFIMRVDAFRRSMRNGELVWRRLVCNKEGFSKTRQSQNGNRKCRAIREGCKAMIIVKKEQSGKWVVAKLVKEHNHPLVVKPVNTCKGAIFCQTPDDKDVKIRELTAELQKERIRSAALQEQLDMVLKDMEDHSEQLSKNINDIVKSVKELESRKNVSPNG
ncbi:protein FAR1-RELATED SEQUENCE 5-like isoform X2 [Lycium barbarum]|uniref:protein FAR1-RELATED SEQUENCE 5-like isoform X2 n=1 Tax=Lycium barbarum TaxID=112863 RepID=UPI00293F2DDA|nr:protein FAR1-RELATED SEQUENCE 5-like isoform X2 [Lycium barbarum]